MHLRAYCPEDCAALARLFYDTVHTVNARDYSADQLDAWADGHVDLEAWNRSFLSHTALVCAEGNAIWGFGDMDSAGYLDRLYVHRNHQGQGVGTLLCDALERAVPSALYTTHASITARPFFERRGYRVIRRQQVERRGIFLTNFVMQKAVLCPPEKVAFTGQDEGGWPIKEPSEEPAAEENSRDDSGRRAYP